MPKRTHRTRRALLVAFVMTASVSCAIPATSSAASLFTKQTPAISTSRDTKPVELGLKFRSKVAGTITGVRYYRGAGATGRRRGTLWSSSGTRLATVLFPAKRKAGWTSATFSKPVRIAADTMYVVSYFAPTGRYAVTNGFFGRSLRNGSLIAPASRAVRGGNGVQRAGARSAFPNKPSKLSNYFVDVLFTPTSKEPDPTIDTSAPTTPSAATGTALSTTSIRLTWGESTDDVDVTGYEITHAGGTVIATIGPTARSWDATGLEPESTHVFGVRARDAAGNRSADATVVANTASPTTPLPPGSETFLATFDGIPASPLAWLQDDWNVFAHSRDREAWAAPESLHAHHAANCGAVATGGTHLVSTWPDTTFQCNNHVMTALNASGYGLIYLTPPALADFSTEISTISWDVSTLVSSSRDWVDIWITPPGDDLAYPLDATLPDGQGFPRNAVHVRMGFGGDVWLIETIRNHEASNVGILTTPSSIPPSAVTRTPMHLALDRTSLTFGYTGVALETVTFPDLGWDTGIVQLGHHSYNPTKDENGTPGTWHWDNVRIEPSIPMYQRNATPRRHQAGDDTSFAVTLPEPSPTGALLKFGAVCGVQYLDGSTWTSVPQPSQDRHAPEHVTSYRLPLAAGTTSVTMRFQDDSWYTLGYGCLMENPVVVVDE